jgi:hypothetical protein
MKILDIAASSTQSKTINYLPEYITFVATTVPTAFKIVMVGDGTVFDLDGTGLNNLNGIRCVGELPANQYIFQVADGYIGKNATFTIANAIAGQLDIYGFSNSKGGMYVMHNTTGTVANATTTVDDFGYVAFPSAVLATDTFTITWADGTTDQLSRLEAEAYLAYRQEVSATRYNFDNYQREISMIQFKGAAAQNVYYTRYAKASGTVKQSL